MLDGFVAYQLFLTHTIQVSSTGRHGALSVSSHDPSYHILSCPQCYSLYLPEMPGEGRESGTRGGKCIRPLSRNVTGVLQPATTGTTVFGLSHRTGCKLQGERDLVLSLW